jgi:hypothetical protein
MSSFFRRWLVPVAVLTVALPALGGRAGADDIDVYSSSIVRPANTALHDALRAESEAQAEPIGGAHKPLSSPGLPTGLTYTLDISSARSFGTTGWNGGNGLPGGFDAIAGYGFNKNVRLQAGAYTFQEYPLGFDTGTVPVYVQGLANPVAAQNLNQLQYNATTNNKIIVFNAQTLITIAHRVPIVITPTYLARNGTIGGGSDLLPVQVNGPVNGYTALVHYRTVQYYLIAVTLPILSTPKFFATLTVAPQWDVKLTGIQTTNHAQLFELAYLEYKFVKNGALFVQPSRLVNNLPTDQTPMFIPTFIYGVNYKFARYGFAQVAFSTGTPSNRSTLGFQAFTVNSLTPAQPAPTLGGLKASQVQFQIGVGSPSVIPL